ncbi:protein VAC14 homolog [Cyclospora cayetanensis]|uniref:Protein VAC14 homolog n=1 Tax=Cyclospora cayetanensis TaxID=88456 RepID=A0A6P6RS56_9EIME|nr:protein VAC14 homolog [Cyclospora cayetanensis]
MYGSSVEFATAGLLFGRDNCRGLADKSFEKRKAAAQAVQQLIKQQVAVAASAAPDTAGDEDMQYSAKGSPSLSEKPQELQESQRQDTEAIVAVVQKAVAALTTDFLSSPIANIRKGGLLGLAAVGLAFDSGGLECCLLLLLRPLLKSFGDPDPRVRYYACESLFNVLKAARSLSLRFLPELFDGLCKLCGDVDREVRQGVGFVDSLLKEETAAAAAKAAAAAAAATAVGVPAAATAATAQGPITPAFIHLLVERLLVRNPYIKVLALSWISLLETSTGIDMLQYLPLFLGGLLELLGDSHRDIRQAADLCVTNFLEDLRSDPVETDPAVVAQTAEVVLRCSDKSNSSFTHLTALVWLHELLLLLLPDDTQQRQEEVAAADSTPKAQWHLEVQRHLEPLGCRMLQSILRSAAEAEEEISRMAAEVHAHVIARVLVSTTALDLSEFVSSAARYLLSYSAPAPSTGAAGAAADTPGGAATAADDVRSLCLQWMELMLVEKPHLLQLTEEQPQQKAGPLRKRFLSLFQQQQQHKQPDQLLLHKQQQLVATVLYTALTAESALAPAPAAVGAASGAAGSAAEAPSRQQSASSTRNREAAGFVATAATNHIVRMALSILGRFIQRNSTNIRVVVEELLRLLKANRSLLDGRGHFALRQLCTMGDPCEVYMHIAVELQHQYESAVAAKKAAESTSAAAGYDAAPGQAATARRDTPSTPAEEGAAAPPVSPEEDSKQTIQFLHQIVQALSIDLFSAKEVKGVRQELRRGDTTMFEALLPTWATNSVWLIALSLYAGQSEVAAEVVALLSREDGLSALEMLQLEQLALLLDSRQFAFLRMKLHQQPLDPHLLTAVRGIGMLLPQGPAFTLLHRRLQLASSNACCSPKSLVSRALSLAAAAREHVEDDVASLELQEPWRPPSPREPRESSVYSQKSSESRNGSLSQKVMPQKGQSLQSPEEGLDEGLTEHGSVKKAFPSAASDI